MNDDLKTPETEGQDSTVETVEAAQAPVESDVAPSAETVQEEAAAEPSPTPEPTQETPAAAATAENDGSKTEDEKLFEAALASMESEDSNEVGSGKLNRGDRVQAKVIQVEKDRVFVDLGTKAEGVIPLRELSEALLETAVGAVNVGDSFDVIVLKTNSAEGNPIVSKKRADFDVAWQNVLDAFDDGVLFQAQVVDRVKGGLVVDIGVRGFVPATHVGSGKLRNIERYVGQTLPVKIIEIDKERKKVVLSNRVAEDERRDELKSELFSKVNPGDILEGTVRRLTDYGAFVDLGGLDGLLHISEMSWMRIDHPREVLKEGEDIKVLVLRLDEGSGRISLGLRQVLPDPWNLIRENYKAGQKIKVTVGRMVQSGVFVRLPEQAEAFLPLSECSDKRLKKPSDELEIGQEIEPTIIDLRPDERRMVLSLREDARPGGQRYDDMRGVGGGIGAVRRRRRKRPEDSDFDQSSSQGRTPTGGATIGERLGMLKGFLRNEDEEGDPGEAPAEATASEEKPKETADNSAE